ncbi:MAG: HupE/UreJ family protein [Bryobacterales bacterium]|nr:HupE/UreJ family protein [Bryobacterales bacterium]
MSMSSGELTVEGRTARLEVRMPIYEVADLADPQSKILDSFLLRVDAADAPRTSGACHEDQAEAAYVCVAEYALPADPDVLEVDCRLAEATVPNHVHILRAVRGDVAEQQVFDYTTTRHDIRFVPLTAWQLFMQEAGAGAKRVLTGPAQLLFLVALALAARSRKELGWIAAAFLIAQCVSAVLVEQFRWNPPPRFVESAGALTIAYLAVETLTLPDAGARWLVAAGMGAFHGLYFGIFLAQGTMSAARVLAGAAFAEAGLLSLFAAVLFRLRKDFGERLFTRILAGLLLVIGLGWFAWRMLG